MRQQTGRVKKIRKNVSLNSDWTTQSAGPPTPGTQSIAGDAKDKQAQQSKQQRDNKATSRWTATAGSLQQQTPGTTWKIATAGTLEQVCKDAHTTL